MSYTINNLMVGAQAMAKSVFGRKREYHLKFNHSEDDVTANVDVIPSSKREEHPGYACLVQGEHSLTGGSFYTVTELPGFERDIWLCPVTLFVLGRYPKYLYIKKSQLAS